MVPNSLARAIRKTNYYQHITPTLHSLLWLPIEVYNLHYDSRGITSESAYLSLILAQPSLRQLLCHQPVDTLTLAVLSIAYSMAGAKPWNQ